MPSIRHHVVAIYIYIYIYIYSVTEISIATSQRTIPVLTYIHYVNSWGNICSDNFFFAHL